MSGTIGQNIGQSSFVPRKVRVIFRLLGHSFGTTGADTVTLDGLHVQADITQAQFPAAESATVRLQGVQPDLINRLSLAAPNLNTQNASELTLASLQPDGTVAVVFQGGVTLAYADYTNAPESSFVVQAFSSALPNALAAPPTSFKGRVPASQLMGAIASKAGLRFVNYGVQATFYNPYCYGSPGQQLAQCLETTPMRVGLGRGQLSVWPITQATQSGQSGGQTTQAYSVATASAPNTLMQKEKSQTTQVIEVSAATGLIGYPSWSAGGLMLRMLFNAQVGFNTVLHLQSRYQPAGWGAQGAGLWRVVQAHHSLQTEIPNGTWFTDVIAQAEV
ncbi:hypothetical protein ACF3NX_03875 [Acetobacter orientalis]|uniref:hypothetical protein n=1 Tax=Acetobacter orientalis TaxID=146474 RepID=UPI00386B4B37